jgi:hypothetical protein
VRHRFRPLTRFLDPKTSPARKSSSSASGTRQATSSRT